MIDSHPVSTYFGAFDEWPQHQREAISQARGRVVDIGCGAGRHSLYLQENGLDVLGIDRSPLAIEVCKERGLRNAEVSSITQLSPTIGPFDTVLMLGNNFGLFANPQRARRLLRRLGRMTSQDARVIAETLDPYNTDEPSHRVYRERNRRRGRMPGQIRMRIRYRHYRSSWFDYLFVSKDEMHEIVAGTGWMISRFFDSGDSLYVAMDDGESWVDHSSTSRGCIRFTQRYCRAARRTP